ncbi:MAG: GNAT family N-acetyltransferase [Eubacteriaceae bacterium]|nr:GNAT family N-acetyltransferase [Eubacteriaceae bacterium]
MGVEEVYEYHREGGKISVFFEKKLDVFLRKARREDVDAISEIYEEIHGLEEKGFLTTGWIRGVYPTKVTARNAVENDEMFVMEKCGEIVAAARINKVQDEVYREGRWQNAAGEDEVMVMHTLVVSPGHSSEGYGKLFAAFYENYAKENNCPYLRIDTNERNSRARKLYGSLGYSEAGVVSCEFNGIKGVNLVLLEKTAE